MRHAHFPIVIVGLLVALLIRCSSAPTVADGSSTETTNGITAAIHAPDGAPAANATVRLRPSDYLAPKSRGLGGSTASIIDTVTDSDGRFLISGISADHYTIEVTDELTAAVLMTCEVAVGDDTLDLGTHTIVPFATLKGMVAPDSATGTVTVGVFGLDRSAPIDPLTGAWSFSDLPPGAYTMRISPSSPEIGAAVIDAPPVLSGSSLDLPPVTLVRFTEENYSQWASSRAIRINTSSSGAGISEDVHSFSLLVRLNATNFSFPSARNDGRDVRFSKQDGTPLRYEIEQWDVSARQAAIWVLIDTIRGNDSTQSFTMHWGTPTSPGAACADFSNGAAVFDTANGFAGVWHLNRSNPGADATHYANHLLDGGTQAADGTVDGARYFDGADSMKTADHASMRTPSFTISCWFRRDGPQTGFNKLACKGDPGFPHQSYTLEIRESSSIAGFQTARLDTSFVITETATVVSDQTWYHLCGTFDAATGIQKLFFSGMLIDSIVNSTPVMFYEPVPWEFYIGAQRHTLSPASFKGWIDEVRIESASHSSAWIKLCHENQKAGSTIVEINQY